MHEPVGAPDAVDRPAKTFENLLPKAVSVTGRPGAVVGRAIALDAQQVPAGPTGVDDREVDEESGRANLMSYVVAASAQRIGD